MIEVLLYYFGYNFKYNNSILFLSAFFSLLFALVILFLPVFIKIDEKNPEKFMFNPFGRIKYIFLSGLCIIFLSVILFTLFSTTISFSENRRDKFLDTSKVNLVQGKISKMDTIIGRGTRKPVAIINYFVNDKNFEFQLKNKDSKYKLHQKLKVKYSLEHPDMFEIVE